MAHKVRFVSLTGSNVGRSELYSNLYTLSYNDTAVSLVKSQL